MVSSVLLLLVAFIFGVTRNKTQKEKRSKEYNPKSTEQRYTTQHNATTSTVRLRTNTRRHKVEKRVDLEFLGEQGEQGAWSECVINDQEENSPQGRLRMGRGHLIWDGFDGQKGLSICLCTVAWLQKRAIHRCLVPSAVHKEECLCSSSIIVQNHF